MNVFLNINYTPSELMDCYQERAFYYFRHGMYGHALKICQIGLEKKNTNLILYIYIAIAHANLGETEEAKKQIEHLRKRKDLELVYFVAQYIISYHSSTQSQSELSKRTEAIKSSIPKANALSIYISILLFCFSHLTNLSYLIFEFIFPDQQQFTKNSPIDDTTNPQISSGIRTIYSWIKILEGHPSSSIARFDEIMKSTSNQNDILCLYGKALALSYTGKYIESIQIYNHILSKYDFPELSIEKSRNYILMQKWNIAIQISEDARNRVFSSLEPDILLCFHSLLSNKHDADTTKIMDSIYDNCVRYESNNWKYKILLSLSLSTLCKQSFSLLDRILKLTKNAYEESNENADCCIIFAYHQYLARNLVASLNTIQKVLNNGTTDQFALEISIQLLIDTGRYFEAQDAIDMYSNVLLDDDIVIWTLKSKLNRKMGESNEPFFLPLLDALKTHSTKFIKRQSSTQLTLPFLTKSESVIDFFITLRADVMIQAYDELVVNNYSITYNLAGQYGEQISHILKTFTILYPNYAPFNFFQALLMKKMKKINESFNFFEKILTSQGTYRLPQCLTEIAELLMDLKLDHIAINCIEQASLIDPTLATSLEFALIKAQVLGTVKESIPFIGKLILSQTKATNSTRTYCPFSLFIRFIDMCISVDSFEVASTFIVEASKLIKHSSEKAMLVLKQSMIVASKGYVDRAISSLDNLKKHQKYLIDATKAQAEIYLKFQNDTKKYIDVFEQLTETDPSASNFYLLGNAHKTLKHFPEAINSYKKANEIDPTNKAIFSALMMSYVTDHCYDEAISLFKHQILSLRSITPSVIEFFRLMLDLKKFKECEDCVNKLLHLLNSAHPTLSSTIYEFQGDVLTSLHKFAEANTIYTQSFVLLETILNQEIHNPLIDFLKTMASNILYKIASNYQEIKNLDKAIEFYQKSLSYNEINAQTVCSLFEIYRSRYDITKCAKVCRDYLNINPQNETIALLYSSIQLGSLFESIKSIKQILDVHPYYTRLLVRLIEMCARVGKLHIAYHYLMQAKSNDPSFNFAVGLYYHYAGNPTKALSNFKKSCVGSNKWLIPAKFEIFAILSNPDRKYIWVEKQSLSSAENLDECQRILDSLQSSGHIDDFTISLLKADLLCSQNTNESVSEADKIYEDLLKSKEKIPIACMTGHARCLMRFEEYDRAEKILNNVLLGKPFHEDIGYFEESYLMMAHIISNKKNFTSSQHFLFLALELNMCCKKAWEMSATVHMKNKMYNEASTAYGRLWDLCDHNDPEIGYNYAFCSMKAKKFDVAMLVCREVLTISPNYKNIQQEVLIPSYKQIKM